MDQVPDNDLGASWNVSWGADGAPKPRKRQGRRRATPPPGVRVYGQYTPVTLRLELRRGSSQPWVYIERGQDAFHVNGDAGIYDVLTRIIHGDLWVVDTPSAKRVKGRRRT